VRGGNGCMPGEWSVVKKAMTKASTTVSDQPGETIYPLSQLVPREPLTLAATPFPTSVATSSVVSPQQQNKLSWFQRFLRWIGTFFQR